MSANKDRVSRRNYYRLLHVQPDAPIEVIKASCRTLILKHHPDVGGDKCNAALINEAYAVLSIAEQRERYDREREGFERHVGPTTHPPSQPTLSPQPEISEPAEPLICAFCTTTNRGGHQGTDPMCGACGAPLRLVGLTAGNASERETRRIEHQADIRYRVDASSPGSTPGRVMDLSPTGLRFISRQQLTPGSVIKIDSPTFSAVAKVTRSNGGNTPGSFSTGVQFLTLARGRPRGTFVSEFA